MQECVFTKDGVKVCIDGEVIWELADPDTKGIPNNFLKGKSKLTGTLKLGAAVKKIGKNAFLKTKLTGLDLSDAASLVSIGAKAFRNTRITGPIETPFNVPTYKANSFPKGVSVVSTMSPSPPSPPSLPPCANTNGGAKDVDGDDCEIYVDNFDADNFYDCGSRYDDSDFTANAMCCVCGGGGPLSPSPPPTPSPPPPPPPPCVDKGKKCKKKKCKKYSDKKKNKQCKRTCDVCACIEGTLKQCNSECMKTFKSCKEACTKNKCKRSKAFKKECKNQKNECKKECKNNCN